MNTIDLKKKKMVARKEGHKIAVTALDSVLGEIDLIEARNNKTVDSDGVMSVIKKTISQLTESQEMYVNANREEMAEDCSDKILFLETLLPKQLNTSETIKAVNDAVLESKASSPKEMGKVIGILKKKHGASLDMSVTSKMVKEILTNRETILIR